MSTTGVDNSDEVNVLQLTLHGRLLGYLAGFSTGRNVLSFAEEFAGDPQRPTFSLITPSNDLTAAKMSVFTWKTSRRYW